MMIWYNSQRTRIQSFLVVRHPYERVVSAYRDKVQAADKVVYYNKIGRFAKVKYRHLASNITPLKRDEMIAAADQLVKSRHPNTNHLFNNPYEEPLGPTFEEFSKAVLYDNKRDMHWAVYEKWCAPCSSNYTAIVKFETLNIDNLYVLRQHGLNLTGFQAHTNPTNNGGTREAMWKSYFRSLDRDLLARYKKRYQIDCLLFGYDCDISQFLLEE